MPILRVRRTQDGKTYDSRSQESESPPLASKISAGLQYNTVWSDVSNKALAAACKFQ